MTNFKGKFHKEKPQKYFCPLTGAHFEVEDLRAKLNDAKDFRDNFDKVYDGYTFLRK